MQAYPVQGSFAPMQAGFPINGIHALMHPTTPATAPPAVPGIHAPMQQHMQEAAVPQVNPVLQAMGQASSPETPPRQGLQKDSKDTKVTSGVPLWKAPKARLAECIEALNKNFDTTLLNDLQSRELCILIWVLTKTVRPYMKLSEFRCHTWAEIFKRIHFAYQRNKDCSTAELNQIESKLLASNDLNQEVEIVAKTMGFQEEWLEPPQKKQKTEPKGNILDHDPNSKGAKAGCPNMLALWDKLLKPRACNSNGRAILDLSSESEPSTIMLEDVTDSDEQQLEQRSRVALEQQLQQVERRKKFEQMKEAQRLAILEEKACKLKAREEHILLKEKQTREAEAALNKEMLAFSQELENSKAELSDDGVEPGSIADAKAPAAEAEKGEDTIATEVTSTITPEDTINAQPPRPSPTAASPAAGEPTLTTVEKDTAGEPTLTTVEKDTAAGEPTLTIDGPTAAAAATIDGQVPAAATAAAPSNAKVTPTAKATAKAKGKAKGKGKGKVCSYFQQSAGSEPTPTTRSESPKAQELEPPSENTQDDEPMCFCKSPLKSKPAQLLACGHTWHASCIKDYMQATGKPLSDICPYKCRVNQADVDKLLDKVDAKSNDSTKASDSE